MLPGRSIFTRRSWPLLTIIVWHFYSVIFNPDIYPMSWAWITGDLTEHEMKEEHGLELEKIKARERGELKEFGEAAAVGGGRVYAIRREKVEKEGENPIPPSASTESFSVSMKPLRIGREHKRGVIGYVRKFQGTICDLIRRRKRKNVFDLKRGDF